MKYAIGQDLSEYNTEVNGVEVGLYNTYKDRPALMAAVFFMTTSPFHYEKTSTIPGPLRAGALDPEMEGFLSDTLIDCVGNKMFLTLLEFLSPYEVYQYLEGFSLEHLPIRRFYTSDSNLRLIMRARVAVWLEYTGGVIGNEFKIAKQQVIAAVNGGI